MKRLIILYSLCIFIVSVAFSQIPQTMSYQGVLTQADGNAVPDGNVTLRFRLYEVAAGGTAIWEETQDVVVVKGLFNAILGRTKPLALPFDKPYWLGITVGTESELSPRTALTAAPYSLNSHSTISEPAPGQGLTIRDADGNPTHRLAADGSSLHTGETVFAGGAVIPLADSTKPHSSRVGFRVAGIDTAIIAYSPNGPAIFAQSGKLSEQEGLAKTQAVADLFDGAVFGYSDEGPGVVGSSKNGPGVRGSATNATGVVGSSETGSGVSGVSNTGRGVDGLSQNGVGGNFTSFHGTGLRATGNPAGDFQGDVQVAGEVYAKSVHVRDAAGDRLIDLNADGTAEFKKPVTLTGTAVLKFQDGSVQSTAAGVASGFNGTLNNTALVVKDSLGNEAFRVNPDGTSWHTGLETFKGGVLLEGGQFNIKTANGQPVALITNGLTQLVGSLILFKDENGTLKINHVLTEDGFTINGDLDANTIVVSDSLGNEVFRVNADGTSFHKGDETFAGDVIFKGQDGKGAKLVDANGQTIAGFGRNDLDTGQRIGVFGKAETPGDLAGAFEGNVEVNGEVSASSFHIVNTNGDTLTSFNADGTSVHKGTETYESGIDLPDRNIENTTSAVKAGKFNTPGNLSMGNQARVAMGTAASGQAVAPPVLGTGASGATPNAVPNEPTVWGYTERGDGAAVFGSSVAANNTYPATWGVHSGGGPGVVGEVRNTSSAYPGLWAITTGVGSSLLVDHQGTAGNIFIGRSAGANQVRIDKTGKAFFNGGTQTGGADVAEAFAVEGSMQDYEPGDVLVISEANDRTVAKSSAPYSTLVAGVYATKPGVLLAERHIDDTLDDTVPMGVVGVIPTKVCDENGSIHRGDLLVTSSTPGYAMKGTDRARMLGATIGKALENFAGQRRGVIKALVNVK